MLCPSGRAFLSNEVDTGGVDTGGVSPLMADELPSLGPLCGLFIGVMSSLTGSIDTFSSPNFCIDLKRIPIKAN